MTKLAAAILAVWLLWSPVTATAGGSGPGAVQVSAERYGVVLSLIVPRRTYPRNALVPVTEQIVNRLGQRRFLLPGTSFGQRGVEITGIQVVDSHGRVLYPPQLLPGPYPIASGGGPLPPGKVQTKRVYVVLWSPYVRAVEEVQGPGRCCPMVVLRTPVTRLRLVPAQAPRITLHRRPPVYVDIHPPPHARGPLLWFNQALCPVDSLGDTRQVNYVWVVARSLRLRPGCPNPTIWRAMFGWVGRPVARINYTRAS